MPIAQQMVDYIQIQSHLEATCFVAYENAATKTYSLNMQADMCL